MSGRRSRARRARARRAGKAQQASGQQGPEAQPPPPAAGGPQDEVGVAPAGHVTGNKPAAQGHPRVATPERPQAAKQPVQATTPGSELVSVPPADMEGCGAGGLAPGLGPELLRLHEVQLCLAQEQLLLEDRRRQVQLQMQLWQEEQLWREQLQQEEQLWREQLWQEEQLWLQQLQEEQAWVRVEGLELAMALEQLRSEGLEVLQTQGQAPGPDMARRSQSSSQGDNPLAPGYLPPHYKEYYRLAVDALAEGGPEAYSRFLASEGAPAFLCPEELEHVSRHLRPPQHVAREPPEGSPPNVDMDGSSGTYWPMNSDQAVPELDLGWPLTFGFQGTEVTTLVQPPPPDSPSIKDEARRMIRSAQQVVAVVMDMFTDVDLLAEVLEAAARRVPVYVLLDEMNAHHFLDMADKCRVNLHHVDFLRVRTVAGPTYYCRTGKSFKGHVKEKFLLVDCAVVMSGSYRCARPRPPCAPRSRRTSRGSEEAGLAKQDSFRSRLNPLIQRSSRLRSSLIFSASQAEGAAGAAGAAADKVQLLHKEQAVSETLGPGGEAVRSATSAKVAELLEKYKGPSRDAGGAGAPVTVTSHSKAVVSQAWREEVVAPGGVGSERRSLESCLLDLRDSFAQRLHQEAERQPGAATLTATQLLDTLGRGGTDRLPSRFLSAQGRSSSPQGRDSPPLEGSGSRQTPHSEPRGSPTSAYPERRSSPVPAVPERRSSPVPAVPERRGSPVPPVPERRGSLTLTFSGESPKTGTAEEPAGGPMEVLRKGSLRLRQLLSPKSERRTEDEGGFPAPQENGQPESPRRPSLGRADSAEAATGDERSPRARTTSTTANALYSSNLRDDTKAILEQISAHGQKHRGVPVPAPGLAHSSPELGRSPAAGGLAPDMSDKDKCSAIFRSDSLGTQGRLSRTMPASAEERERLLRRMESMRKEKRVYSRFEVFCKKEEAGGPGAGEAPAEEDTRDSKVGKFMPKILGTFKSKK
ncbi:protein FAM83H [Suricata suricatta]|uniref:protein FAM83H n=1 Tax=Suricata suricatta TaxID=37032 RepID=UPI0011552ACF|nr:protein FAM83H [Suricata suricatta]